MSAINLYEQASADYLAGKESGDTELLQEAIEGLDEILAYDSQDQPAKLLRARVAEAIDALRGI